MHFKICHFFFAITIVLLSIEIICFILITRGNICIVCIVCDFRLS